MLLDSANRPCQIRILKSCLIESETKTSFVCDQMCQIRKMSSIFGTLGHKQSYNLSLRLVQFIYLLVSNHQRSYMLDWSIEWNAIYCRQLSTRSFVIFMSVADHPGFEVTFQTLHCMPHQKNNLSTLTVGKGSTVQRFFPNYFVWSFCPHIILRVFAIYSTYEKYCWNSFKFSVVWI